MLTTPIDIDCSKCFQPMATKEKLNNAKNLLNEYELEDYKDINIELTIDPSKPNEMEYKIILKIKEKTKK